jgi:beta-lactam-binding protein with PASTA domain
MFLLNRYTEHNRYIEVPDLSAKSVAEVTGDPIYSDFQTVVIDSAYEMGQKPGTIISQDPLVGSRVKHNRKIYVTVVSTVPDKIAMPDLKFLTLRQATSMLESYGLKLGTISYTRSFDEDAVQQQYFEGKRIAAGTLIYKGSIVDLVVGLGLKGMQQEEEVTTGAVLDDTVTDEF